MNTETKQAEQTERTKLMELGSNKSNLKATPGNFRACVMLGSCIHQIGDDVPDRSVALGYCEEYSNENQSVQIFDDKGEIHIIKGKIKTM